jgi:putative transposase
MATLGYVWRKLTASQREDLLGWRKQQKLPWHRPPHRASEKTRYHITAACYEHSCFIGHSRDRIEGFSLKLLEIISQAGAQVHSWCALPNHYHLLIQTPSILDVLADLGRMHGRLSFDWNRAEQKRGRQVWCGANERYMRNNGHFWATLNYVHHNPVHHGYVAKWQDWPYSSAKEYLAGIGRDEAARLWLQYPVLDYGKGWDDPNF